MISDRISGAELSPTPLELGERLFSFFYENHQGFLSSLAYLAVGEDFTPKHNFEVKN